MAQNNDSWHFYIKVESPEHCVAIQHVMRSLGYDWAHPGYRGSTMFEGESTYMIAGMDNTGFKFMCREICRKLKPENFPGIVEAKLINGEIEYDS